MRRGRTRQAGNDRAHDADRGLHVRYTDAARSGEKSPGVAGSKRNSARERLRSGPRGPGSARHLSAGLRERVGYLRAWSGRFPSGRGDPGCAEPAAPLPRAPARSALPRIAGPPGQYRLLRRHRARERTGPGGDRKRRRPAPRSRRSQPVKLTALDRAQDAMVQRPRLPGPVHHPGQAPRPAWSRRPGRGADSSAAGRPVRANTQQRRGLARSPRRAVGQNSRVLRLASRRPYIQRDHHRAHTRASVERAGRAGSQPGSHRDGQPCPLAGPTRADGVQARQLAEDDPHDAEFRTSADGSDDRHETDSATRLACPEGHGGYRQLASASRARVTAAAIWLRSLSMPSAASSGNDTHISLPSSTSCS